MELAVKNQLKNYSNKNFKKGRYVVKYSMFGGDKSTVYSTDSFKKASEYVLDMHKIIKNAKDSEFIIEDRKTGFKVNMVTTKRGLSISNKSFKSKGDMFNRKTWIN